MVVVLTENMKWILLGLAFVAAGLFLGLEKSRAAVLQLELARERAARRELAVQQEEHARLRALQPSAVALAELQHAVEERAERQRAIDAGRAARAAEAPNLPLGEWLPPTVWQDRGRSTPAAAVETMLWAAMGGDTGRLQSLFHFDESTRAKLEQFFSALPASTRATYAAPEQLVAAFTARGIPMGEAQIVWQQQSGPDEAVACVWVTNPPGPVPTSALENRSGDAKTPPMLPSNVKRSQALLLLHRHDDGWRVIVPGTAIDRLAAELKGGK